MISHDELQSLLKYSPESGDFTWIVSGYGIKIGRIAGNKQPNGYIRLNLRGRRYFAHRLAWFYVHGSWPTDQIDHINGDPSDNRLVNLRESNQAQNRANSRRRNDFRERGLPRGVGRWSDGVWYAQISINGRNQYLGKFGTLDDAERAFKTAALIYRGEFARLD